MYTTKLNFLEEDLLTTIARCGPVLPANIHQPGAVSGLEQRNLIVKVWIDMRAYYAVTDRGMGWLVTNRPELATRVLEKEPKNESC